VAATPTTTRALKDAFRTAISAIAPRTELQRDGAWKFVEGERTPGTNLRVYSLDFDTVGYTKGGFMGAAHPLGAVDTTVTLTVFADYGGVPRHEVKHLAEDDFYQLRDVLSDLKPTTNGLLKVETIDWDFTNTDQNQAQIAYQFEVRYMKARAQ
jgi:hypothetical protein